MASDAPIDEKPSVFARAMAWGRDGVPADVSALVGASLAEVAAAGSPLSPESVPWQTIELMGWDPVVALGEATAIGPALDSTLYYVTHSDPGVVAEHEAWLQGALLSGLLEAILAAPAYGVAPYVLDWSEAEGPARYADPPHALSPAVCDLVLDASGDVLLGVRYQPTGVIYGAGRGFAAVPRRRFGSWRGQGSRCRAYAAWYRRVALGILEGRYYERSVDPPRVGYAPKGVTTIDGQEVSNTRLAASALLALRGGGATALPSEVYPNTSQRAWDVQVLDLPDRSGAWDLAVNRQDARILLASMVPPTSVGASEASFAGGRVPATMFSEVVQGHANDAARELTRVVSFVHRLRHGDDAERPEVWALEIPAARKKLLLDVFRSVASATQHLPDGRTVTLAELVAPEILPALGIPSRKLEEAAHKPAAPEATAEAFAPVAPAEPGPDRSATSDRDERRDAAREPEGEDDTGGPR